MLQLRKHARKDAQERSVDRTDRITSVAIYTSSVPSTAFVGIAGLEAVAARDAACGNLRGRDGGGWHPTQPNLLH